jgi:hypothetical protein
MLPQQGRKGEGIGADIEGERHQRVELVLGHIIAAPVNSGFEAGKISLKQRLRLFLGDLEALFDLWTNVANANRPHPCRAQIGSEDFALMGGDECAALGRRF